jgi:hypothetical protein
MAVQRLILCSEPPFDSALLTRTAPCLYVSSGYHIRRSTQCPSGLQGGIQRLGMRCQAASDGFEGVFGGHRRPIGIDKLQLEFRLPTQKRDDLNDIVHGLSSWIGVSA